MRVLVHNLALSFFLFTTVMTRCFKILDSMLKYVCFTLISTFNLTPLATSMTGWDGRKTLRFYRLIRLVVSCPSLLVLKYKEILISCSDLCILATVTIGCDGRNLLSLDHFLLSCSVCYVRFRCRTVGVCRLLLGECTEPYRELVRLVFVVVPLLFCFCM